MEITMAANMMTTQKWYDHITDVIISSAQSFYLGKYAYNLEYIEERKGSPIGAM